MADFSAPPNAGNCMIRPTPAAPCPYQGVPGPVSLTVKNISGSVTFLQATYSGGPVVVTPQTLTFTIVAGQHDLDVLYFFSDTVSGQGDLHEICPGNTFLGSVLAGAPAQRYTICA
jgi:hypothetical protein